MQTHLMKSLLLSFVLVAPAYAVPIVEAEVVARYPHDREAFTQGLVWHQGRLFESTGLYGQSGLREVELATGRVLREVPLDRRDFGEGITVFRDRLFQLTWRNGRAHVYDLETLQRVRQHRYRGEGWGLTHDGRRLIMSDGSATLRFIDPLTFRETGRLDVTAQGGPLPMLNALQFIDGKIYANVWTTTWIAVIDPSSGEVETFIELAPLLEHLDFIPQMDLESPNGIAWDPEGERLFVTGKLWPWLFHIRRVP